MNEICIENNLGLVISVVKKFTNRGYEFDDLYQVGCIGLIKASERYDPSLDIKFSTYAVSMIIGELKSFLRDDGNIKVSRSLKSISIKAGVTKEIMAKELNREPSISELADRLNITKEELVLASEACAIPESLYSTILDGENKQIFLIDKLNNQNNEHEDGIVDKIALKDLLRSLDYVERQIIFYRYFKEKTQSEIAKVLGISQAQISRIEKKVLKEMKEKIG